MRTPTNTALALLVAALPGALRAQENLYPQASAATGVEIRQYAFGSGFAVDKLRQIAFPAGVLVPVGKRFSFDIGASYAVTTLVDSTGNSESFSNFTDTQLRASYMLGTDALVVSVMMNLPTGKKTTTLQKFGVAASASSNFLLFPVNSYGAGFSVTPGVAAATTVGDWNLGLAASVRVSSSYTPFSDASAKSVKYKPGVETRIRGGVDRLIGASRLTAGLTFSTFSNDELRGGSLGSGAFDPGNRFLVDLGFLSPVGNGTVGFYAWDYYRSSSGSTPRENVLTTGANGNFRLSPKLSLEPIAEARFWMPESGTGSLFGVGTSLRIEVSKQLSLIPGVRADVGRIRTPGAGKGVSLTGWNLNALMSYGF
jgi:hypothetical protein